MTETQKKPANAEGTTSTSEAQPSPSLWGRSARVAITLAALAIAVVMGRWMWLAYMESPWTRDGVIRASIIVVAPQVSGVLVDLPLTDNQFVKKDDLLIRIDPTDYRIALDSAEAALRQARAGLDEVTAQETVQRAQVAVNEAQLEQQHAALIFARQQADRYTTLLERQVGTAQAAQQYSSQLEQAQATVASAQATLAEARQRLAAYKSQREAAEASIATAQARLEQAKTNLSRTEIRSPVNGWVANLLARAGNFATAQRDLVSIVDADSFWVDAYFEETTIANIQVGDSAKIKLMGYDQPIVGRVDSMARAIDVANARPNVQGVATVNPVFTWVRLAQRIPVRILIDEKPKDFLLAAGMTATVQIDRKAPRKPE